MTITMMVIVFTIVARIVMIAIAAAIFVVFIMKIPQAYVIESACCCYR